MTQECRNCRHADGIGATKRCLRYPPRHFHTGGHGTFPFVDETWRCGEWQAKGLDQTVSPGNRQPPGPRQSFSHGRSGRAVVETVKRRVTT